MDLADPVAVALAIADVLRAEGTRYALYGGLLLAAYGDARETRDVDVAIAHADARATAALLDRRLGLHTIVAFDRRAFGGLLLSHITLVEGEDLNSLDLVEPADPDYTRRALDRALDSTLRERPIRVLTPEDFLVFKLLSTRERDHDDARSVVRGLASELDRELIDREVQALAASLRDVPVAERWRDLHRAD